MITDGLVRTRAIADKVVPVLDSTASKSKLCIGIGLPLPQGLAALLALVKVLVGDTLGGCTLSDRSQALGSLLDGSGLLAALKGLLGALL